jgi:hypothetical protein
MCVHAYAYCLNLLWRQSAVAQKLIQALALLLFATVHVSVFLRSDRRTIGVVAVAFTAWRFDAHPHKPIIAMLITTPRGNDSISLSKQGDCEHAICTVPRRGDRANRDGARPYPALSLDAKAATV